MLNVQRSALDRGEPGRLVQLGTGILKPPSWADLQALSGLDSPGQQIENSLQLRMRVRLHLVSSCPAVRLTSSSSESHGMSYHLSTLRSNVVDVHTVNCDQTIEHESVPKKKRRVKERGQEDHQSCS